MENDFTQGKQFLVSTIPEHNIYWRFLLWLDKRTVKFEFFDLMNELIKRDLRRITKVSRNIKFCLVIFNHKCYKKPKKRSLFVVTNVQDCKGSFIPHVKHSILTVSDTQKTQKGSITLSFTLPCTHCIVQLHLLHDSSSQNHFFILIIGTPSVYVILFDLI